MAENNSSKPTQEFEGLVYWYSTGYFVNSWPLIYMKLHTTKEPILHCFKSKENKTPFLTLNAREIVFNILTDNEWAYSKFPEGSENKLFLVFVPSKKKFFKFYPETSDLMKKWKSCLVNNANFDPCLGNQEIELKIKTRLPDLASDAIRKNKSFLFNGKKKIDHMGLLDDDKTIQQIFEAEKSNKSSKSIDDDSSNINDFNDEIEKDRKFNRKFYDRYFNEEVVKKLIFTPYNEVNPLYNQLDLNPSNETFPIKLYIAKPENVNLDQQDSLTRFVVRQGFATKFGLVHAALQIADKVVHFFTNSFVKIDRFKGSNALYLININSSGRLPKSEKIQQAIAEVIVKWNKEAVYDHSVCNCQDFVEDLCDTLNKKFNLSPPEKIELNFKSNPLIKKFLDELVDYPDFATPYFKLENIRYVFKTHEDLDKWEAKHVNKLEAQDRAFLKGFHRAFQLQEATKNGFTSFKDFPECLIGNPTV